MSLAPLLTAAGGPRYSPRRLINQDSAEVARGDHPEPHDRAGTRQRVLGAVLRRDHGAPVYGRAGTLRPGTGERDADARLRRVGEVREPPPRVPRRRGGF